MSRLRSLQATSGFAPGGARIIAEADDRNPLAQLLRTTNETMLGRSLQFDSASGRCLTLDVAGRRVLRLTSALGLPGAERCLGIEALEDEHKDDLIKLLQAIAASRHELRVTSGPIGRGGEQVSVGLPVALLADLLLIDLNEESTGGLPAEPDATPDSPMSEAIAPSSVQTAPVDSNGLAAFAGAFGEDLLAWLIVDGEDGGSSSGPDEMVSHLQSFLDDEREAVDRQLDALSETANAPICLMLGATLVEGHSILCARFRGAVMLGVVEGDATMTALAAWRGLAL